MDFKDIQKMVHELAKEKGWWDQPNAPERFLANTHAELSEAWEEVRQGYSLNQLYFEKRALMGTADQLKPLGFGIELADAVIRIMDFCEAHSIDLEALIQLKHEYNKTRSYRHGDKHA